MTATQSKKSGANVRLPPPLVFVAALAMGVLVQRLASPLATGFARAPRLVAAGVVGLLGLALLVGTLWLFRRSGQDPRPWTPSPLLIVRGPYRLSRNPMYGGAVLVQAAIGLALDNLWILLFGVAALAVVHYTAVVPEERYLSALFGEDYRKYVATVRRYL